MGISKKKTVGKIAVGLVLSFTSFLLGSTAYGYAIFPLGGGEALKWGSNTIGTGGGTVSWSLMPDGTGNGGATGVSGTSDLTSVFDQVGTPGAMEAIEHAFDAWAAVADIGFVGPVSDSGLPFNDMGAIPVSTGDIRIGAFSLGCCGAVGFAPHPNGGTLEGDVLFNSDAFFQIAPGSEGDLINYAFGNEFGGLFLHEVGHALGLAHSSTCSVMSVDPACYAYINRQLDADDIAGIQYLYGPNVGPHPDPVPEPGSLLLLVTGYTGMFVYGRYHRKRAA